MLSELRISDGSREINSFSPAGIQLAIAILSKGESKAQLQSFRTASMPVVSPPAAYSHVTMTSLNSFFTSKTTHTKLA